MNMFVVGIYYLCMSILMAISCLLTIVTGIIYYAYLGVKWLREYVNKIGKTIIDKANIMCLPK